MKPKNLRNAFLRLCQEYAKQPQVLGTEIEQNKKSCAFNLFYRNVKLQLVYHSGSSVSIAPSVLYCRVFPDKNCPLYLHIPQLLPLLEIEDYRACYFPYIESHSRMEACFAALTEFWEKLYPILETLASAGKDRDLLEKHLLSFEIDGLNPEEVLSAGSEQQNMFLYIQRKQDPAFVVRFTKWSPWEKYLDGKLKKAASAYKKQKDLLIYEQGLCAFLETPAAKSFVPIKPECYAAKDLRAVTKGQDDGLSLFIGMLVLYPVCAALGCLLMGLNQIISAYGTLCWLGAPWYEGFMLGGLPAIFGGIALRRQLMPIWNRKTSRQQLEFDDIINSSSAVEKFAMGAFVVATALTLFFGVMMANGSVRLYDTYGDLDDGLFGREKFYYEQIDAIYHIQARYNDYGDRIEYGSYVIAMEDGRLIDLYGNTDEETSRKEALPIFEKMGIAVIELDSDRDLPGANSTE